MGESTHAGVQNAHVAIWIWGEGAGYDWNLLSWHTEFNIPCELPIIRYVYLPKSSLSSSSQLRIYPCMYVVRSKYNCVCLLTVNLIWYAFTQWPSLERFLWSCFDRRSLVLLLLLFSVRQYHLPMLLFSLFRSAAWLFCESIKKSLHFLMDFLTIVLCRRKHHGSLLRRETQ